MLKKTYFMLVLILCGCYFFTETLRADELPLKFSDKPPEGFEDLSAPQRSSVDIYFGNDKIADALATFSPNEFQLSDAQTLLKAIPRLKESEKNTVLKALTGNLDQHSDLICHKVNQPSGCGQLKPDVAGIIFNADTFKVHLFINPNFLDIIALNDNPYIPFPEKEEIGFIQNLGGSFAGSNEKLNYNFRATSILSYYLSRLRLYSHASEQGFQIDSVLAETEWRDNEAALGLFRTQSTGLLGQQEIAGVRVASSFKQRTDLRTAYGNELVVFLPQRALVKVFRDNQLLTSQIHEAGNRSIDTSYFPDGVYDVDIIIEEEGTNNTRKEHFFFAKSISIPPLNHPTYAAEVGLRKAITNNLTVLPHYSTMPLIHLGTAKRLTDFLGYDTDIIYSNKEIFATLGLSFIYSNISLRLAGSVSNTGYSAEIRHYLQLGGLNITGNLYKSWQNPAYYHDNTSLSLNSFTQADFSLAYNFSNGINLNVRTQWRQNNAIDALQQNSSFSITPSLRLPLWQHQGFRADLGFFYTLSSQDQLAMLSLRLQQSTSSGISLANQSQIEQRSKQLLFSTNSHADWQDGDNGFINKRLSLDWRKLPNSQSVRLGADYRATALGVGAFIEQGIPEQGNNDLLYGGQLVTNITGDKEGISLGSAQTGESAVILDLRGTPEGAGFDVLASRLAKLPSNENKITNAYVGAKNIIALEPYETYAVRLVPHKSTFAHYENKVYTITLYPATVARLVWKVKQTFTLITLIERPDGSLITNARIEGAFEPAIVDDQGLLQADVSSDDILMINIKNQAPCQIKLPEQITVKNGVVMLDKLICFPVMQS